MSLRLSYSLKNAKVITIQELRRLHNLSKNFEVRDGPEFWRWLISIGAFDGPKLILANAVVGTSRERSE